MAARDRRIEELESVASWLAERVVERERELREARADLTLLRDEQDARLRMLETLLDELDRVRAQARSQATRIRLAALRDAAEVSDRIAELPGAAPGRTRERLLESLHEAIVRLGGGPAGAAAAPGSEGGAGGESPSNGQQDGAALFSGLVQIEIGPLSDFSQLVGFEDAAEAIAATSEISLTRFSQGRATLEMRLKQPVELLRELEERAPFDFRVRDMRSDRVVLDVGD